MGLDHGGLDQGQRRPRSAGEGAPPRIPGLTSWQEMPPGDGTPLLSAWLSAAWTSQGSY